MRSELQATLLTMLRGILNPLVSLCLKCGLSYQEFESVLREAYVKVASEEYGLRGRPTNASRVAAMTGISRKEIKKIREQEDPTRWTPAMELSPGNLLLHYWHYDEDFYQEPGVPRALPLDGEGGFTALVRRYAGDIPPGAVKEELKRAGVVDERDEAIRVMKRYFQPEELDADFIRNIAFSIRSVATTVVHNAKLVCRPDFNQHLNEREGRFERFVWSDHLGVENQDAFRCWVRTKGARFIEDADDWIGENETSKDSWNTQTGKTVGVGLYYFEDDHDNEPGAGGSR